MEQATCARLRLRRSSVIVGRRPSSSSFNVVQCPSALPSRWVRVMSRCQRGDGIHNPTRQLARNIDLSQLFGQAFKGRKVAVPCRLRRPHRRRQTVHARSVVLARVAIAVSVCAGCCARTLVVAAIGIFAAGVSNLEASLVMTPIIGRSHHSSRRRRPAARQLGRGRGAKVSSQVSNASCMSCLVPARSASCCARAAAAASSLRTAALAS